MGYEPLTSDWGPALGQSQDGLVQRLAGSTLELPRFFGIVSKAVGVPTVLTHPSVLWS